MNHEQSLILPPPIVRERLAKNIRERRILRSLLKLSIREAEERQRQQLVGDGKPSASRILGNPTA